MTAKARHDFMMKFYDHWLSVLDISVPVIAAIDGACIGVAPIFACVSDICIADETANFQITFAGLGLCPGMAMSYVLPKLIGSQRAALVGPHIMIVSPHENQKELQSFSHDGSNGMPYVAHLPNWADLYLVMPIREWNEKD